MSWLGITTCFVIYAHNTHFPGVSDILGIALGTGDTAVSQTNSILAFGSLHFSVGRVTNRGLALQMPPH